MNKQDAIIPSWLFRKSMFTLILILSLLLALSIGKRILMTSPESDYTSSKSKIEQIKK